MSDWEALAEDDDQARWAVESQERAERIREAERAVLTAGDGLLSQWEACAKSPAALIQLRQAAFEKRWGEFESAVRRLREARGEGGKT